MERISFKEAPQGMIQVLRNVEEYIAKCSLDKRLLELVRFRVSQINTWNLVVRSFGPVPGKLPS